MQILDLRGGSGASYRFRRVEAPGDLPAHAGNFVRVATKGSGRAVLSCGTRRSLLELGKLWNELVEDGGAVFVRLNVSLSTRMAEHDDLVAALHDVQIMRENN